MKWVDAFRSGDFMIYNTSTKDDVDWWESREVGLGQASEN